MLERRVRGISEIARVLLVLAAAAGLVACSSDDEEVYVERPVVELYNDAMDAVEVEEYKEAVTLFDEVERQHPYSKWATEAQIMAGYSHYMENNYDDAIAAMDRFIQLHPSSPKVAYAYYLKGLCYYEQISDVGRDQKMTENAASTFRDLVNRFPTSPYTRDAKLKIDLTQDHLAGKHMEIGRYYQSQRQYLSAINRFKLVVERYQTTTHTPEALHRLVECYEALGLVGEARKVAAVLGHNFPGSEWYIDSYGLVEGQQVRHREGEPWYRFWDEKPTPRPIVLPATSATPAPVSVPAPEVAPAPASGPAPAPAPEADPAAAPAAPSADDEIPWYKFW